MARKKQSREDLEAHLKDQIGFLKASCDAFDRGFHGEARRLATALRVLLHDKGRSHSLLGQLGLKDQEFFDSAGEWNPRNVMSHHGLIGIHVSTEGSRYYAPLDQVPFPTVAKFDEWWDRVVFVDDQRRTLTRGDVVLSVANQDGGAHVDPALDEVYSDLSRSNSLGWKAVSPHGERDLEDPHFFAIRQVAHEVLVTLEGRIPKAAFKPLPRPRIISMRTGPAKAKEEPGRNDPCPCGSGKKWKKCCGRMN